MKLKKIILSVALGVFMFAQCMFILTACGGGNGGDSTIEHTQHTYGDWEHNDTQHWRECTGCTAEEREDHKYNGGYTCDICGYVNESLKPGESQSMSTYFSGMKTISTRASVKDADNVKKSFDDTNLHKLIKSKLDCLF